MAADVVEGMIVIRVHNCCPIKWSWYWKRKW